MKKIIASILLACLLFLGLGFINFAQAKITSVKGYVKKSTGTYVMPYYKTSPNKTKLDNFSAKGNYNPFTGKKGYTSPFKSFKW